VNIVVSLFISLVAHSAPFPGTSSSEFLKSDMGLYQSNLGFSIHAGKTSWIHTTPPADNSYVATVYKAPYLTRGVQPALTVRLDQMKKNQDIRSYMKQWLKDYPRMGFKVLGAKKLKINNQPAYLIDLLSQNNSKQLRQVVFVRNKQAVILSCRDHQENFEKTVKDCNQIVRNFQWANSSREG